MKKTTTLFIFFILLSSSVIAESMFTIKEPYPKYNKFVFLCNIDGFEPTNYSWWYGDGHKLIEIQNQNTYHTFEQDGTYTVKCSGQNEIDEDDASITVVVKKEQTDSNAEDENTNIPGNSVQSSSSSKDHNSVKQQWVVTNEQFVNKTVCVSSYYRTVEHLHDENGYYNAVRNYTNITAVGCIDEYDFTPATYNTWQRYGGKFGYVIDTSVYSPVKIDIPRIIPDEELAKWRIVAEKGYLPLFNLSNYATVADEYSSWIISYNASYVNGSVMTINQVDDSASDW